jgi:hypothetical protein
MDASLRPDATTDSTFTTYAYARMADEPATSRDPLPVVLKAGLTHIERGERDLNAAEGHYTSAGLRFKELKDRVKAAEAGKVSWADYCAANIPTLTQRTVEGYIAIAEGEKRAFNLKQEVTIEGLTMLFILAATVRRA